MKIAYSPLVISSLLFSHIIPPILAFIAMILIITGIMDSNNRRTLAGVLVFLIAGLSPFVILPLFLG
ncbi:MAG: hypothetical protein FGO69_04120 [Methanobacterium sp.]|jgi:TctA family transporter|nr:MAG: hypothetical protein FGO69_04120 [Methanobacterium sp.]